MQTQLVLHTSTHETSAASDEARTALKRLLEEGSDDELARAHRKLFRKGTNACSVKSTPSKEWKPKSVSDAVTIVELLREDVGLRRADTSYNLGPDDRCMKIVCSEIVERLRFKKGIAADGEKRPADTSRLSLAVATVIARVVEEVGTFVEIEPNTIVEKSLRLDAPTWGTTSAKGSGCLMNTNGYRAFRRALLIVEAKLKSMEGN